MNTQPNKTLSRILILFFLIFTSFGAFAGDHHHAPQTNENFNKLKNLVGTWEGSAKMDKEKTPIKLTYELSSGGTIIIEKLMVGTPQEMVTVYSNRGKDVNATHYCMIGNQPEMKLKKQNGNTFAFEMDGAKGIANKNEEHMHALTINLDGNKLSHSWVNFKNNKKSEVAEFEFVRK